MAQTGFTIIQPYYTTIASGVPTLANMSIGEIAINLTDRRIFTRDSTPAIVELGTNPSSITTSSATITGGSINGTTVGATTPSTGAFTTLSSTGTTSLGATSAASINNTPIGATTRSTGAFTTLAANGATTLATVSATDLTTTGNTVLGDATTDTLNVGAGGIIKDAAGNVGIGVTPSAWGANERALEVGDRAGLHRRSVDAATQLLFNSYTDGAGVNRYKTSDPSTKIALRNDVVFSVAPSGVAGNPITFTQAMTLTQGGNLLVGTTTDSGEKFALENGVNNLRLNPASESTVTANGATGLTLNASAGTASMTFRVAGAERARITPTGNLLVGTTSDIGGVRLNVRSGIVNVSGAGAFDSYYAIGVDGVAAGAIGFNNTGATNVYGAVTGSYYFGTNQLNQPLVFTTQAAERARITAGGNLLVGAINDTGSLITAERSGAGTVGSLALSNRNSTPGATSRLSFIGFRDVSASNGIAAIESQGVAGSINGAAAFGGNLVFRTKADGSEGDSTERARITSTGNLLVGTTDPDSGTTGLSAKLKVDINNGEPKNVSIFSTATNPVNSPVGGIRFSWYSSNNASIQMLRGNSSTDGLGLSFYTSTSNSIASEAERARITANGNLLVGTTTDSGFRGAFVNSATTASQLLLQNLSGGNAIITLDAQGANSAAISSTRADGALTFVNAGIERARIINGGYFKASNTGSYRAVTGSYHEFYQTANTVTVLATPNNTGANAAGFAVYGPAGFTGDHFEGFLNESIVYRVSANGNVQNTNNSYGAISDIKLKENVVDATPKLDKLNQLRVVNYNLIGSDLKQIGLIAQEVERVFPGLVEETPDTAPVEKTRTVEVPAVLDEDGNETSPATTREETYTENEPTGTVTKAVKYSVLVPMLVKAVQELTERLERIEDKTNGVI